LQTYPAELALFGPENLPYGYFLISYNVKIIIRKIYWGHGTLVSIAEPDAHAEIEDYMLGSGLVFAELS
jgi:hypothetical protein